ncbi:MAG TPA: polysaccharide deacetylase family protein [Casimicrobiaceae bacterium]
MFRHLLILLATFGIALPGVVGVASAASADPASPPESVPPAVPLALPTITPSASPSPGDVTPPVTTATGMGSRWRNDAATVKLTATDDASGVAGTAYRVDDGDWLLGDRVIVRAPRDHGNDGEHVITFYSVDNALNAETPKMVTVKIDTRPPHFAWHSVSPAIIKRIESVSCRFTIDEHSGPVRLSYKVVDQYGYSAAGKSGLERGAGKRTVEITPRYKDGRGFMPGVYRVQFTLEDEAGNQTISNRRSFRDYRAVSGGVWRHVGGAGKVVALTFDDGGAGPWASMLDTLKRYKMHATFFPLGPYVAASPGLARRTVQEGNAIGTHGWTHTMMSRESAGAIQSEWMRANSVWWSLTGAVPMPYCRPPYGDMSSTVAPASAAVGFSRVILWDVDPQDWSEPGSGVIASRVLSHVHSGAIVCMHLRGQTAAALPTILSGLKARGYRCVSLPELFHAAGMH